MIPDTYLSSTTLSLKKGALNPLGEQAGWAKELIWM
jgi:hypothetical protein